MSSRSFAIFHRRKVVNLSVLAKFQVGRLYAAILNTVCRLNWIWHSSSSDDIWHYYDLLDPHTSRLLLPLSAFLLTCVLDIVPYV